MKNANDARPARRTRERAHAKLRFQPRFGLVLNRDRIHEIERQIARGQAILIEARSRTLKSFFVRVDGHMIAVYYRNSSNRVVTALPNAYVTRLPPEKVAAARLLLFPEEAPAVMAKIVGGEAEKLHTSRTRIEFFSVEYMGCAVLIGYARTRNKLVPYQPPPSAAMN